MFSSIGSKLAYSSFKPFKFSKHLTTSINKHKNHNIRLNTIVSYVSEYTYSPKSRGFHVSSSLYEWKRKNAPASQVAESPEDLMMAELEKKARLHSIEARLNYDPNKKKTPTGHKHKSKNIIKDPSIPINLSTERKEPEEIKKFAEEHKRKLQFLDQIISKLTNNTPLDTLTTDNYNEIMKYLIDLGDIEHSRLLLDFMKERLVQPNQTTYNLLLFGLALQAQTEVMENVLEEMTKTVGATQASFHCLVIAYEKIGKPCNGPEFFHLMRQFNVPVDVTTCNLVLRSLSTLSPNDTKLSNEEHDKFVLEYTEDILYWMNENDVIPDKQTYNHLIYCCRSNLSRGLQFFQASIDAANSGQISKEMDPERISAILRIFGHARKLEDSIKFIQEYIKSNPSYSITPMNRAAIFFLHVRCFELELAFDTLISFTTNVLKTYSNNNSDELQKNQTIEIPLSMCWKIIETLKTLPEAVMSETQEQLDIWAEPTPSNNRILSKMELIEWQMSLIRWRSIFVK